MKYKSFKRKIQGFSGILHELELIEINGKEYALLELSSTDEEELMKLLSKIIICYDVSIPPVLLCKCKQVPQELTNLIKNLGGIIMSGE